MQRQVCFFFVHEIKPKVFNQSYWYSKKLDEWRSINAGLLGHVGQKDHQRVFLSALAEEIVGKMPNYKFVSPVKLNAIDAFPPEERAETSLGMTLENVREKLCPESYRQYACRSQKCFEGRYPSGTDVDGLIIHGEDLCFLEYENKRDGLCDNFMKIYRLRRLLNRDFESLFVTKVTNKLDEGSSTFNKLNDYLNRVKPILEKLLHDWGILEIVTNWSDLETSFYLRPP